MGHGPVVQQSPGKETPWKHGVEFAKSRPWREKGQERIGLWSSGNTAVGGNGSRDLLKPLKLSEGSVAIDASSVARSRAHDGRKVRSVRTARLRVGTVEQRRGRASNSTRRVERESGILEGLRRERRGNAGKLRGSETG
jgi:hypothetical protein